MPKAMEQHNKLTPPIVARMYGVSAQKILAWIHSGELRAMNAATRTGGRPRYLIDPRDLAEFEVRRAVKPATPTARWRHPDTQTRSST